MNQLEIKRKIDAPRDLVWDAFSKPEHLKHWWGPKETELEIVKLEFKPGGIFHYAMVAPDGNRGYGRFLYLEIEKPHKMVYLSAFADEKGNAVRAPFAEHFPIDIRSEVTFEEEGNGTLLTMRSEAHEASDNERDFFFGMFDNMRQGFGGTLDVLENYLCNKRPD